MIQHMNDRFLPSISKDNPNQIHPIVKHLLMSRTTSKENTARLFNRYVWLVDTIQRAGSISLEEIQRKWEQSSLNDSGSPLPQKTFHNHRKEIAEMFDIEIECNRKNGYKYFINNQENLEKENVKNWLFNSFSVNNMLNECKKIKDRILFEKIPGGQKHLLPIIESMRDGYCIEIEYQKFDQSQPEWVFLRPYCVKVFKQRWYLLAYNENYKSTRTYALDRIQKVRITTEKFILPKDFNGEEYFLNSYGINCSGDVQKITLKVSKANFTDKYFKSLPLHSSQTIIKEDNRYAVFQYHVRPSFEFVQEILSHGSDVEVIAPESLRQQITRTVQQLAEVYSTASHQE